MPSEFTQTHLAALKDKHQSHLSPLAVIAHVDLDAFYAQCEQVRLNLSKTDPVVCRQWNGLIAISYAARQYGVTRNEPAMAARAKCPDIVFAHVATFLKGDTAWAYHENPRKATHKVSLDPYRRESRKIFGIFKEHCRVVEKASIDETYLDLGEVVYKRLLELFPELREDKLKPGAPLPEPPTLAQLWEKGVEWMGTIYGSYADESETRQIGDAVGTELYDFMNNPKKEIKASVSGDQAPENTNTTNPGFEINNEKGLQSPTQLTDLPRETILAQNPALEIQDWDDVCLLLGSVHIRNIRKHVLSSLQYTCSAGVARNRVLAKLGSSRHKPAKQVIIRRHAVSKFMAEFELTDVGGLGGKLGESIMKKLELPEHGSIRHLQEQIAAAGGGKAALLKRLDDPALAKRVVAIVEGNEAAPVGNGDATTTTKSMMATKNFAEAPVSTATDARAWLRVFAAELESRLLELSESTTHITLYPKTITMTHKLAGAGAGPTGSQNKQVSFPSQVTPARLRDTLYELGCALLAMFEHPEGSGNAYPCALLALGVSNFVDNSALLTKNRSLTSFFKAVPKKKTPQIEQSGLSSGNNSSFKSTDKANLPVTSRGSPAGGMQSTANSTGESDSTSVNEDAGPTTKNNNDSDDEQKEEEEEEEESDLFVTQLYTCPECQAKLDPHKRSEHADFHFAQRLAAGTTTSWSSPGSRSTNTAAAVGSPRVAKRKPPSTATKKKKKPAVFDKTQTRLNF